MKKKLLTVILAIAATLCLCFGITACNIESEPETQGHEHAYTLVEAHNPTCTESGNVLYYTCTCGKFFDGEKREIEKAQTVVPAIGHDYKMTWTSSDNKNAQVVLTCQNDSTHVYRCDGAVVENRTEATCEVDGSIEYTVTVEYDNNTYSETHTEKIDKLNHNYATPKWTWTADKTSATLELICTNDAEHKIVIENVSISDEERPNACTIDVIYTATASYNGQTYSDTQTVTKEGSHTFGDYTQTEDGHTRSCSGCGKTESGSHTYENGKCSVCNYEHQNHSFDSYIKDENGHSYTCDVCHKTVTGGHNYEDGICVDCEYEHVGHTFGNYVSDEEGHSHTCSVCKKAESDVHSYADGKCSVCNYEHEAHSFGNYSANDDTHSHTCGVCHKTVTDKHEYVNGKCETCKHEHSAHKFGVYTSDESEHSHTCDICHKTVDGTHSYANGRCTVCEYEHKNHEYGPYTTTDDKHLHTCTVCQKVESGNHTFENGKCSVCDYERENHTFGNYECTEETHTRVCGDCKKVESGQHVYVNGVCEICQYQHKNHEFENYTSDDEKHTHVCGVCHKAESGVHDYENGQCATCQHEHSEHQFGVYSSDDSQHTHTCNVCHKTESGAHDYKNGQCLTCQHEHENHSFGTYTEKQPTCTENGYKERSCEVCHKVEHEELVASGHKYDKGVCTVCGDVQNWIAFKTLIADGETVYGKVSNNTDTFSFLNEIIVGDGISYTVSTDIQGSQTIPSKTSPVEIGDNIFYILASKGEDMKLFTVTVRRRPIYTLTFSTSGTAVESKQVEEDSAIQSVEETSKTGYTFVHWTLNDEEVTFPYTIRQDIHCTSDYNVTFTAVFSPNSYDVALDAAGGEVVGGNQSVTFNESYQLPVPTRTGYSFTGWYEDETQLTDGEGASLSKWEYAEGKNLTAHWSANRYYLTVDKNIDGAGSVTGDGSFTYDSDVTVTATDYLGYIFSGWYSGGERVYEGNSYSFKMGLEQTLTAHWQLDPAMSDFVFTSDETTCTITGVKTNNATELNIPDYVTTVKTSAFDNCALLESITVAAGNTNYDSYAGILYNKAKTTIICCPQRIRNITGFPESFTSIASGAFAKCSNLISIVVPETVTSIAEGAFKGCSSLESIILPFVGGSRKTSSDTYQYPFGYIFGISQFDGATAVNQEYHGNSTGSTTSSTYYIPDSLKSVTIMDGEIPHGAFHNCNRLESVTIGDKVTSIAEGAFKGCGLLGSVTLPFVGGSRKTSSDTYQYPFGYIFGISQFDGATAVNQEYHGNSTGSTTSSTYYIPDSLKSVTIMDGEILFGAFYNCNGLESVTIGNGVTSIGSSAFYNCDSLTSITIPASVTSIEEGAFNGCSSLESMTLPFVGGSKKTANDTYQYPFGYIFGASSYSGSSAVGQHYYGYSTTSTTDSTYYIPDSLKNVTIIGGEILYGAFYNCDSLTSITIPEGVTSIGSCAFRSCISLRSITIPNSVISIGYETFYNCDSLTSITIPDSVTSIGDNAFNSCNSLKGVYITDMAAWCNIEFGNGSANPLYYAHNLYLNNNLVTEITANMLQGVTEIKDDAFFNCTSLGSITIPDSVTSIGDYAFEYCTSLENIAIPNSVTSIGGSAFEYCTSLEGVYISDIAAWCNIEFGNYYANPLYYAHNLYLNNNLVTEITANMLQGVTEIKAYAFSGCTSLTSITIPDSVTSIGDYAFEYCTNLTSITILEGVTSIGDYAFFNCTSLESINFGNDSKLETIGSSAFYDCTSLEGVYISDIKAWCNIEFGNYSANPLYYAHNLYLNNNLVTEITANMLQGVTEIKAYAFRDCTNLESITMPEGVTSIGSYAFSGCTSLEGVYISDIAAWCNIEFGNSSANPLYYAHNLYLNNNLVTEITANMLQGVTEIKAYAFYKCTSLTSITIPEGVTSIGSSAFRDCTSLESITISDSVTSIGSSAFSGCTNLESINFGNDSKLETIGSYAFSGCAAEIKWGDNSSIQEIGDYAFSGYKGTSITIPEGVTSIGDDAFYNCTNLESINFGNDSKLETIGSYAFSGCTSLTSITIPDSVTSIGSYAFSGCAAEIKWGDNSSIQEIGDYAFSGYKGTSITIPNSVTTIGSSAFRDCTSLESITISDSVTSIDGNAFENCTKLIQTEGGVQYVDKWVIDCDTSVTNVNLRTDTKGIADSVFSGCTSLTSITIPEGVTSIGSSAFYNCTSLTSITIPNSVTFIGSYAFSVCKSFGSITIPNSVTSIGASAFNGCTSLEGVYITDFTAWCNIEFGNGSANPLYYAHNLYLNNNLVTEITANMLQGVTEIKADAFYKCTSLTSITIPASVTSIGYGAFSGCTSLRSITIPDSVTSIGYGAFSGCTNLESINFGNDSKLETIGSYAFSGCKSFGSITIPNSVTSIGASAFNGCTSLEGVYITDIAAWCNIEFGDNPLYYAHNLYLNDELVTNITADMLQGVTEIKADAFYKCTSLTSITIPEGVTSIGNSAFNGCTSLRSITIPDSVTSIGSSAFYKCTSLRSINFGNDSKLETIGSYAFSDCTNLTSITIHDGVTSIGHDAFNGCTSLTSVTFKNTSGWKVSSYEDMRNAKDVTLGTPAQNADYLKNTYKNYYWKKES